MAGTTKKMSAVDKARAFQAQAKHQVTGIPENVPSDHESFWFVPHEVREARTRGLRAKLEAMGYEPAPEGVYVPGVDGAEVWIAPNEVVNVHFEARKARNDAALMRERKSGQIGRVDQPDMRPAIN